jgi:phosphatidylethanolamine/phosphatidyl-N-methylethanolamine N-methyltransferase
LNSFVAQTSNSVYKKISENLRAIKVKIVNEAQIRRAENWLFFRRWLKNPRQLGTLAPISGKLAKLAACEALTQYKPGVPVVEIGAGTGRLTRALLQEGVQPEDFTVVELDGQMCEFLKTSIPSVRVIEGDANQLPNLIAPDILEKVAVVVSAIPLMYLDEGLRKSLMNAAFSVLRPNAKIVHVTYNPKSPLSFWNGIQQSRVAATWFNIPPGFVWKFQQ